MQFSFVARAGQPAPFHAPKKPSEFENPSAAEMVVQTKKEIAMNCRPLLAATIALALSPVLTRARGCYLSARVFSHRNVTSVANTTIAITANQVCPS